MEVEQGRFRTDVEGGSLLTVANKDDQWGDSEGSSENPVQPHNNSEQIYKNMTQTMTIINI